LDDLWNQLENVAESDEESDDFFDPVKRNEKYYLDAPK
jgi:hypothetical protein